jgi:predicted nuclease with TOPRIM domain
MVGYIDWIIILIALMAAIGALLLLYPQTSNRESQRVKVLRLQAEHDQRRVADVLEITHRGAQDTETLVKQLKEQVEQTNRTYQASLARVEQAERIIERVTTAEHDMHNISTQLGERLQHLQGYWDEQLGDSVESVKHIRTKLHEGLTQVDDSMGRLREQEKMAQGFTRKLIEHHQEQIQNQHENSRLSSEVHVRLEEMLKESSQLLEQMKRYQQDADTVFQKFTDEMDGMETQASEQFSTLFRTTDTARHELNAGMEESRQHIKTMRRREEQSSELSRRIRQQFEKIEHIRVERIAKTLDVTEQMSTDLHKGMESARELLSSLELAAQNITTSLSQNAVATADADSDTSTEETLVLLTEPEQPDQQTVSTLAELGNFQDAEVLEDAPTPHNLVTLRAYRQS